MIRLETMTAVAQKNEVGRVVRTSIRHTEQMTLSQPTREVVSVRMAQVGVI